MREQLTKFEETVMRNHKKIITWLIGSLLIFITLIMIVMALMTALVDREMVRETIEDKFARGVGGEIKYLHLELSYFPRPHIVIHKAQLMIPDSFTIKIQRMKVYPKIMPLFRGSLQIGIVTLEYADYFMKLPQLSDESPKAGDILSFDDILKEITTAVSGLPEFKLPDLNLKIKSGSVNLTDPIGRRYKLRGVQADYRRRPDKLDFSIKCKSNLWDQIDINGSLNPSDFKGRAHIQISRFRPQTLLAYFFSDSGLQTTATGTNLDIDLELDGTGNLAADFNGAILSLATGHAADKLIIQGGRIKGSVQMGGKAAKVILTELASEYPKLNLSGIFSYDQNQQDIRLAIDGSRIDAGSVRQVVMALSRESETIRDLFDIIRGGHIPWMTVRIRGQTIAELGLLDNMVIQGRLTQGKIFIPEVALDLEDVVADTVISKGILQAENLQVRLGNTHGQDGKITLGLNENLAPFHLRIGVTADLSQLPSVLSRIVENKDFLNELAYVQAVKGSATGILTLDDDPAGLNAKVEVSKVQLTARYKRLPYPIEIEGEHVVVDGNGVAFDNLNASSGKSSLSQLSATINWAGTPSLEVKSKTAKFDMAELHPYLLSFDKLQPVLRDFSATKGLIELHDLNLKGPLYQPARWHYDLTCKMQNLALTSETFGDPVSVNNAAFDLSSERSSAGPRVRVDVKRANLTWGGHHLNLMGAIRFAENENLLDMTLTADGIDWEQIENILDYIEKRKAQSGHLAGTLKVQADNFNYKSYSVHPLHANVFFKPENVVIEVNQADVCGIPFRGLLKVSDQTLEIFLIPSAVNQKLATTISCLTDQKDLVTGTFNLNGDLLAKSKPEAILRSLGGKVAFSAEKGRIHRFGLLAKMLAVLNITEIHRGEIPDLAGEGFAYHRMRASAHIKGGLLTMTECAIDGASMGIACEGNIDLVDGKMDLTILLAPFKTVDRIVDFLPLVGHVLGGKLISIPFRVKGDLKDPDVIPLHPTAVGSGVLGILERTLKLPITIIQPLFSGGKK